MEARCEYCGTIVYDQYNNCPNCGAVLSHGRLEYEIMIDNLQDKIRQLELIQAMNTLLVGHAYPSYVPPIGVDASCVNAYTRQSWQI